VSVRITDARNAHPAADGYGGQDSRCEESTATAAYQAARRIQAELGLTQPLVFRVPFWGGGHAETWDGYTVETDDDAIVTHVAHRSPYDDEEP